MVSAVHGRMFCSTRVKDHECIETHFLDSEVDKLKNCANCDKSMKLGENTQFDMHKR